MDVHDLHEQILSFTITTLILYILGKEMVDYIADYLENIRTRRVFPNVVPGYMRELVPDHAPVEGEAWENIFRDVERVIMPGVGSKLRIHVLRYINNYDAAVHSNSLFNVSNNSIACCGRH